MAKGKTKFVPAVKPAYTPERFMERYNELCREFGLQIAFEPRWAQSRDQGDYRLVIVTAVVPLPKEN